MSKSRRSKRFDQNLLTKKVVPAILIVLIAGLFIVMAIIALSLTGGIPPS